MAFRSRPLVAGEATGVALVLDEPLSFWGGYDPRSGRIIDGSHPQLGQSAAGRILVMAAGRGSSSSSSVLAEALRLGTAPAAIVLAVPDPILLVGFLVARELYRGRQPLLVASRAFHHAVRTGDAVGITAGGAISIRRR
jgi:uncharacterized protein